MRLVWRLRFEDLIGQTSHLGHRKPEEKNGLNVKGLEDLCI